MKYSFDLLDIAEENLLGLPERVQKDRRAISSGIILSTLIKEAIENNSVSVRSVSLVSNEVSSTTYNADGMKIGLYDNPYGIRLELDLSNVPEENKLYKALHEIAKKYKGKIN